jgi:hypothetical protein
MRCPVVKFLETRLIAVVDEACAFGSTAPRDTDSDSFASLVPLRGRMHGAGVTQTALTVAVDSRSDSITVAMCPDLRVTLPAGLICVKRIEGAFQA